MPNVGSIQDQILAFLDDQFIQPVIEQSIPEIETVRRNVTTGKIEPYIAIQFGDIQQGRATSMIGPRGDDYSLPIYVQCIAPTAKVARDLQNKLVDRMLGWYVPWSGQVRKRPGGGMFALNNSNNSTEALMFPASFSIPVQFE